jgi:hypothetical protein
VGDDAGDAVSRCLAAFAVACCSRSASDCNRSFGTVGSWILLWSDLREHAPTARIPLQTNAIKIVFIISEKFSVKKDNPLLARRGGISNHKNKSAARNLVRRLSNSNVVGWSVYRGA